MDVDVDTGVSVAGCCSSPVFVGRVCLIYYIPYLSDITPHKYRFLPCGMIAVTFDIYFLILRG